MSVKAVVNGLKYEIGIFGLGMIHRDQYVYFPAEQMGIQKSGRISLTEARLTSLAAQKAMQQVVDKIFGDCSISEAEIKELIDINVKAAENMAVTHVQISNDLVDQIKELYAKSIDDHTSQDQSDVLKCQIREIIQKSGIFI